MKTVHPLLQNACHFLGHLTSLTIRHAYVDDSRRCCMQTTNNDVSGPEVPSGLPSRFKRGASYEDPRAIRSLRSTLTARQHRHEERQAEDGQDRMGCLWLFSNGRSRVSVQRKHKYRALYVLYDTKCYNVSVVLLLRSTRATGSLASFILSNKHSGQGPKKVGVLEKL